MPCYKRITVKIGSNVLTRPDGTLDVTRISALVDQIADLRRRNIEVILVSSGAVASGRSELGIEHNRRLDAVSARQLFSAVGQAKLILRTVQGTRYRLRTSPHDERKFRHPPPLSQPKALHGSHARKRRHTHRQRERHCIGNGIDVHRQR